MKRNALIVLLVLSAGVARAQLDQILAPLPIGEKTTNQLDPGASTDSGTVQQEAAPAAAQARNQLTGDQLITELQKQLAEYFSLKGDLKLTLGQTWQPLPLPAKDCQVAITNYPSDGVTNNFGLNIKVTSGGMAVGEYQLFLRAQLWQSVWVTQGALTKGQGLDRTMLNSEKIDVLRTRATYLSDEIDPAGYDIAQGVNAGRPLTKTDVIERPVVHRGDVVEVIAQHGLLDIHMKAQALEDGGISALIKLRNIDSQKSFTAQVINENEVKVQF